MNEKCRRVWPVPLRAFSLWPKASGVDHTRVANPGTRFWTLGFRHETVGFSAAASALHEG